MKKNTLIILFTLTSFISNAQLITTKKNGGEKQADYIFASAGVSMPVGLINSTVLYKGISAYKGPIVTLGCHHFYNKRWGMGLVASMSTYKGKTYNNYPDNYSSSDTWQRGQLYINASYTILLKNRFTIDLVQGIGFYYIKTPAYIYSNSRYYSSYNGNFYPYTISHPSNSNWNNSFNIGIKSRLLLKENIGLLFSVNYFYTLDTRIRGAVGFNSVDCELGIVLNFKNKK